MSRARVQPGAGNDSGPGVGGAETLEHGQERGGAGRAEPLDGRAQRRSPVGPKGTTNWYCTNPRGP